MKARFFGLALAAAGLAGCASEPGGISRPYSYEREIEERGPGLFGDLRWNVDTTGRYEPVKVSEEEEFKKWKALENNPERREFEEWRAWQEWKRKNPK